MRYYIFRNNTLEPLFGNLDACYSGYGDISSLEEGADRYIWFYQVPFGFDRCRVAEEVLSYIDKLRWVIEKIPAHKSVLVFSLVDLCPFQWAGSEWEVQESIETYNKYLRSLASERSNVRYVDLPDFTRRYSSSQLFDWRFYFISQMGINPKLASDFSCWFEDRLREISLCRKKCLVLDLDNTLWGGIVGDDGPENLEIGQETNLGQVYAEFQSYVKSLKDYGVMLNVASKNEEENALAGLNHPAGVLKPEDFLIIAANWEPKSRNILEIAHQLNILPDSLVFADDNPAEREIVRQQAPGVTAPEIGKPEDYIRVLDRGGYFEVTSLSEDDRKRNEMYQANLKREKAQASFADYAEYLRSLDMKATIRSW